LPQEGKLWIKIIVLAALTALRLNVVTSDTPSVPRMAPQAIVHHQAPEQRIASPVDSGWWCNG
jgi:hypothetical protein